MKCKETRKNRLPLVLPLFRAAGIYGWYEYQESNVVPTTRLAAGGYYPEMPPDESHYYIIKINLNRSRYQGEVMVWSGTADPSFFQLKWGNGSATRIPIQD